MYVDGFLSGQEHDELTALLQDQARWAWRHSIPAVKSLRYSVTFRSVCDPARWTS